MDCAQTGNPSDQIGLIVSLWYDPNLAVSLPLLCDSMAALLRSNSDSGQPDPYTAAQPRQKLSNLAEDRKAASQKGVSQNSNTRRYFNSLRAPRHALNKSLPLLCSTSAFTI